MYYMIKRLKNFVASVTNLYFDPTSLYERILFLRFACKALEPCVLHL